MDTFIVAHMHTFWIIEQLKETNQVVQYRPDVIVEGNSGARGKISHTKWNAILQGATMTDGTDMSRLWIGQVCFIWRDTAEGQLIYAPHGLSIRQQSTRRSSTQELKTMSSLLLSSSSCTWFIAAPPRPEWVILATTRSDEAVMDDISLADLRRRFPMI